MPSSAKAPESSYHEAEVRYQSIINDKKRLIQLVQERVIENDKKFGDTVLARDIVNQIMLGNALQMAPLAIDEGTKESFVPRLCKRLKKLLKDGDFAEVRVKRERGNAEQISSGNTLYSRGGWVWTVDDTSIDTSGAGSNEAGFKFIPEFSQFPRKYRNHIRHTFPKVFYFLNTIHSINNKHAFEEFHLQANRLVLDRWYGEDHKGRRRKGPTEYDLMVINRYIDDFLENKFKSGINSQSHGKDRELRKKLFVAKKTGKYYFATREAWLKNTTLRDSSERAKHDWERTKGDPANPHPKAE